MKDLYGFRYDFIRSKDIFMLVSGGRHPLMEDDLQSIAIKMLEYNQIPGLLDMSIENIDFRVTLHYKITGKRLLSQELKTYRLQARSFFQLLVRIGSIMDEARAYYLDESRFVLDNDFIFVGQDLEDLQLVYLPIQSLEHGFTLQEQWRELALELLEYVDDLHLDDIKELLGDLKRSDWTLGQAIKAWIQKLTVIGELPAESRSEEVQDVEWNGSQTELGTSDGVQMQEELYEAQAPQFPTELGHAYVDKLISLEKNESSSEDKVTPSNRLQKFKISLLLALSLAIISILAPIPIARYTFLFAMFFCIGMAGLFYWKASSREQRGELDWEVFEDSDARQVSEVSNQLIISEVSEMPKTSRPPATSAATTILRHADSTTVLQKDQGMMDSLSAVYLERIDDGQHTRRKLQADSFVIGRESSAVDWALVVPGISRMHCEIVKEAKDYHIKDLGSKNGSYLNGELLVPYKTYQLEHLDHIRVADIEFKFFQEELPAKL